MKRITVLLAEDHMIVRQGLRALLSQEDDIEVVGEAANGRQAVVLSRELCPGVIVMDMSFMGKFEVQGRDAGRCLNWISANDVDGAAGQWQRATHNTGGALAWPALLRKLDAQDPSYRT